MVVTGRDIGYQRPENIKRCPVANPLLDFHIVLYLVKRNVSRPFNHNLTTCFLRFERKFA